MSKILFNSIIVSNTKHILLLKKDEEWMFPNKRLILKEVPINTICKEIEKIIGVNLTSKDCISMVNIKDENNDLDNELEYFYLFNINENEVILINKNSGFSDGKWISFEQVYTYLKDEYVKKYMRKIEKIIF